MKCRLQIVQFPVGRERQLTIQVQFSESQLNLVCGFLLFCTLGTNGLKVKAFVYLDAPICTALVTNGLTDFG